MKDNASPNAQANLHLTHRCDDLEKLLCAYSKGNDSYIDDIGTLTEYGLDFDYVPASVAGDNAQGYWRYLLSCGGPREEFRFYALRDMSLTSINFVFLDRPNKVIIKLHGKKYRLLKDMWQFFCDTGIADAAFTKANIDL